MYEVLLLITDIAFMLILIICIITDIKKRIVPNTCIVLLLVICVIKVILDNLIGYPWWMHVAGLVYTIPFFIEWNKNQMGAGDVKMILVICMYLGLFYTVIFFIGMAIALLVYVLITWMRGMDLTISIPLVPFIMIGYLSFMVIRHFV